MQLLEVPFERNEALVGLLSPLGERDRFRLVRWVGLLERRSRRRGFRMETDLGRGVGDPALMVLDSPVGLEVASRLGEVVSGGVDGGVVARPTEGYVSEFAPAPGGKHMGAD